MRRNETESLHKEALTYMDRGTSLPTFRMNKNACEVCEPCVAVVWVWWRVVVTAAAAAAAAPVPPIR